MYSQPTIQWQQCFGSSIGGAASCIQQTRDGGYIVSGTVSSGGGNVTNYHGNQDCWIVKLDNTGTIQKEKCFGGSASEEAYYIQQTTDHGYIFVGVTNSHDGDATGNPFGTNPWVVKIDTNFNIEWQKSFGDSSGEVAYCIQQTSDGGYIIAGSAGHKVIGNHGATDFWMLKLTSTGAIQWEKCLGGSDDDDACTIRQTTDGGFIIAGLTYSNDGDVSGLHIYPFYITYDYWVVKTDSIGTIQWQRCLGGSQDDEARSIIQTSDGGYIVAGSTLSNDGDVTGLHLNSLGQQSDDYWVVKLNGNGEIQWQKCVGGSTYDYGQCIQQTIDGGYIVIGTAESSDGDVVGQHGNNDCWVVKLNNSGGIEWQKCIGGSSSDGGNFIQQTADSGYIIVGGTGSVDGDVNCGQNRGYWVIKLSENDYINSDCVISIFPNPSSGDFEVRYGKMIENGNFQVFDVLGQKVFEETISFSSINEINLYKVAQGMYIIRVYDGEKFYQKKFIVQRK